MAVESLEYLTIKSVKKCMHPFDNTKLAAYTITFKDDKATGELPGAVLRGERTLESLSA